MKQTRLIIATVFMAVAAGTVLGCGHKDPLEEAAPPVSSTAQGLGNANGHKPTAGTASQPSMGGPSNGTAGPATKP